MTTFRHRIEAAIEAREPLDTPELRRLAAEEGEPADWQKQVRLDRAIAAWQSSLRPARHPAVTLRRAAAAIAATAAGLGAVWLATSSASPETNPAPTTAITLARTEPVSVSEPSVPPPPVRPSEPLVAPRPMEADRFAQAAVTAERLAYAFEPVGERVGTVVRFLVDAVPGSDVFSM